MRNVSKFIGTLGIEKIGSPPDTLARSPTLGMGISNQFTKIVIDNIAARVDGIILVTLGRYQIISIVRNTKTTE
jgi:putative Mn2+ efflux pump MntP